MVSISYYMLCLKIFLQQKLVFWLVVGGFWAASLWLTDASQNPAVAADKAYNLAEVAKHHTQEDCWMIIGGQVYDFTAYLPQHPANPAVFLPWCGKDATQTYQTKTKGRPHSPYADQLRPKYRIGTALEVR